MEIREVEEMKVICEKLVKLSESDFQKMIIAVVLARYESTYAAAGALDAMKLNFQFNSMDKKCLKEFLSDEGRSLHDLLREEV